MSAKKAGKDPKGGKGLPPGKAETPKARAREGEAPIAIQAIMGRPTDFSEEIADRILEQIADGVPLKVICAQEDMPHRTTVRRWRMANSNFRVLYAQAREDFAHSLADDMLPLADDSRIGSKVKIGPLGEEITTGDMVERSRLQLETRKWLASKILPKKYGDKLEVENTGEQVVRHKWGG